jgi:hypothetical protein
MGQNDSLLLLAHEERTLSLIFQLLAGARLRPHRHPAQGGGPGGLRSPLPPRSRPVRGRSEGGKVGEKAKGEGP